MTTKRNAADTIKLMQQVYGAVYNNTESLEELDIGADLAYLLGAILENQCCALPASRPIVKLLHEVLPDDHGVFTYIKIEEE